MQSWNRWNLLSQLIISKLAMKWWKTFCSTLCFKLSSLCNRYLFFFFSFHCCSSKYFVSAICSSCLWMCLREYQFCEQKVMKRRRKTSNKFCECLQVVTVNSEEKCEYNLRLSAKWKYLYIILKRQRVKEMKYDSVCEKNSAFYIFPLCVVLFHHYRWVLLFNISFFFFWHYFVVLFDSIRYSCVYLKMIQHEKNKNRKSKHWEPLCNT